MGVGKGRGGQDVFRVKAETWRVPLSPAFTLITMNRAVSRALETPAVPLRM